MLLSGCLSALAQTFGLVPEHPTVQEPHRTSAPDNVADGGAKPSIAVLLLQRVWSWRFAVTLYDASELDRDGESIDLARVTAREPVTLQIDHDRSFLKTVGRVSGIRAVGSRLRGTLAFAAFGVSNIADQVRRQVEAGVTSTVSIRFLGTHTRAAEGHSGVERRRGPRIEFRIGAGQRPGPESTRRPCRLG